MRRRLNQQGPVRPGRQGIGQPRKKLAHRAGLKIDTLQCVQYFAALHQNDVGIAPHQLGRQGVAYAVAHLIRAGKIKKGNALARYHAHIHQPAAGKMLAQQHAERGRRGRVFKCLLRKAHAGRAAARRHQQAVVFRAGAHVQHHLIARGFKYFVDARIHQRLLQLARRQFQKSGIQCHILFSFIALPRPLFPAGQAGMFFTSQALHPTPCAAPCIAPRHILWGKSRTFFIPGRLRAGRRLPCRTAQRLTACKRARYPFRSPARPGRGMRREGALQAPAQSHARWRGGCPPHR